MPRHQAALRHLRAVEPRFGPLIARVGPCPLSPARDRSPYEALARAIAHQQLHGRAAEAILERFCALYAADFPPPQFPPPEAVLATPEPVLRATGLSASKIAALRDLAAQSLAGLVPSWRAAARMEDAALIERLVAIRGIGRWTVEMLLIFHLGRPDVFPASDYGIRKGFALAFQGLKPGVKLTPDLLPKPEVMEQRAKRWAPWRSAASWYLWRACDLAAAEVEVRRSTS